MDVAEIIGAKRAQWKGEITKGQFEQFMVLRKGIRKGKIQPDVREISLKGFERIPKEARLIIKKGMKGWDVDVGGSLAARSQLPKRLQKSYAQSDVDLFSYFPKLRARLLGKSLIKGGIKDVRVTTSGTYWSFSPLKRQMVSGEISIGGKKVVEFHTKLWRKSFPLYERTLGTVRTPQGYRLISLHELYGRKLYGGLSFEKGLYVGRTKDIPEIYSHIRALYVSKPKLAKGLKEGVWIPLLKKTSPFARQDINQLIGVSKFRIIELNKKFKIPFLERFNYKPYTSFFKGELFYKPYVSYKAYTPYSLYDSYSPYKGYKPYKGYSPYKGYKPYKGYSPYKGYKPYKGYMPYQPYKPYKPYKGYMPYQPYKPYKPYKPYQPYMPYRPYQPYYGQRVLRGGLPLPNLRNIARLPKMNQLKRKLKYKPSLVAGELDIFGKPPGKLTGVEIRPIKV